MFKNSVHMTSSDDRKNLGFTLIELMIVIAMIATLAAIALPIFGSYMAKAKVARAKAEIRLISNEIISFYFENGRFPVDLAEINLDSMLDPYGNPYRYAPSIIGRNGRPQVAHMRKDHNLVPVNTDFDLYSMGEDGRSVVAFTAKASQDDIVRANNGQFIGLVSVY